MDFNLLQMMWWWSCIRDMVFVFPTKVKDFLSWIYTITNTRNSDHNPALISKKFTMPSSARGARLMSLLEIVATMTLSHQSKWAMVFLAARSAVNPSIPKLQAFILESSGSIIAAGAQESQSSWGSNNMGGFFTNGLIGSIRDEVSKLKPSDQPSWQDIMVKTKASTEKKSQMCSNCKVQNPIYLAKVH